MRNGVGIDLGTSTIRVATAESGILAHEPSLLAVDKTNARILAIGNAASETANQNPRAVLMRPFSKSLVARKSITKYILSSVYSSLEDVRSAAIAVPCRFSAEDAEMLLSLANESGFSECVLVYAPVAAMLGSGFSPETDSIFVDIGSQSTEIALILHGRTVYSDSVPIAGEQLDRAIADYLVSAKKLRVSLSAAEMLKIRIGSAWSDAPVSDGDMVSVSGENTENGLSATATVYAEELMPSFEETVDILVSHICSALRRVPLSSVESLFRNGIFLCGGGARLSGLDRLISALTGVHTSVVSQPSDAVVLGLARVAALEPSDIADAAVLSVMTAYPR